MDPQGSWFYLGKQLPQFYPTSKVPAKHRVNKPKGIQQFSLASLLEGSLI